MMLLSQAAQVLGAKMIGSDVRFTAVSTDSRKIAAGDLFIALKGENFDGSAYVAAATRDGAVAAIVNESSYEDCGLRTEQKGGKPLSSPSILNPQSSILLVKDTRLALGQLAAYWRSQFDIPVVGLTGSNGKTTVKEMLASILREATGGEDDVLATQGNLNNDIGMPLTLLRLSAAHRYAVIEMGMNHSGEIDYLTRIARSDVALINNASGAHLAGLGTVEAVAQAKGEIFAGLKEDGIAIINADDAYAALWRNLAAPHRMITFALDAEADVGACWDVTDFGIQMEITAPQGSASVQLQVPGAHNARNALAAAAAALALNIPLPVIVRGLEKFGGVAGRLQRKPARNGAMLIDDTYNANPASMRAALHVLAQASGKRIFVMGDMGELGADAARLHGEIGTEAKRLSIQHLLALGDLSSEAVCAFGAGAQHFTDVESLCQVLDAEMCAGVTVLVKGSRFMKMERVVSHCMDPDKGEERREKGGAADVGGSSSPFPLHSSLQRKEQKCCSH